MEIDDRFWLALGAANRDEVAAGITAALIDGADPNAPCDEDGHTALYWAAESGDVDRVGMLLDAGARPDAEGSETDTSLHAAVEAGARDVVQLLLASGGCDLLGRFDYLARTPLHIACADGRIAIARLLIEAGADVDARDEARAGNTALRSAVEEGRVDAVRELLGAGADPTLPGWMQLTAIHAAQRRDDETGRRMLRLMQEARNLDEDAWRRLLLP